MLIRVFCRGSVLQSALRSGWGTSTWQGSIAPPALPGFVATTTPSDFRPHESAGYAFPVSSWGTTPVRRISQVPDRPLDTRRPLSPRGTGRLHMPVASSSIRASPSLEGWPFPFFMSGPNSVHACALRLASCASPGSAVTVAPLAALGWLHVSQAFTWSTLSFDKDGQAWPDAPEAQRRRGSWVNLVTAVALECAPMDKPRPGSLNGHSLGRRTVLEPWNDVSRSLNLDCGRRPSYLPAVIPDRLMERCQPTPVFNTRMEDGRRIARSALPGRGRRSVP